MRLPLRRVFEVFVLALFVGCYLQTPVVNASPGSLATVSGAVVDNKGNPLAGALISLVKEGASKIVKETRSDSKGNFTTRILPGRYGIHAIARGFNEVVFSAVEVRASQELIYRFNLEPIGSGKTLVEQRRDRDDVRWTLRSAQTRRSIFQAQEGEDGDIQAIEAAETAKAQSPTDDLTEPAGETVSVDSHKRVHGVLETYFSSSYGAAYPGLNFAVATNPNNGIELIFAGQVGGGPNETERFEATTHLRAGQRHRVGMSVGAIKFTEPIWANAATNKPETLGQFSVRAVDEWVVRDGIVILLGLDYSRFLGAGGARSLNPRIGVQFDANARTRLRAGYAAGGDEARTQSIAAFENSQIAFTDMAKRPIAFVDGQAVMERSHRLEFGVERVLDNKSTVEATAFFDTTSGRGIGMLSTPMTAFSGATGEAFISVANQQGASRGMRLVYTRRLSRVWTASAGYSFGRGQRLASGEITSPNDMFENSFFQTAAFQLDAGFNTGTNVRTVLRFSPNATVFAIDPFAGRLGVYDPSLSIQVTQELPSFGLPIRAEAVLDARNLLDTQTTSENGEVLTQLSTGRRSVRGGISLRF
ncbi:MAG TPA: carboxypeptidase regulatory-like domain-containing protein [Pyrinomonadaceae bacterium]|nr:carboxypeptidase regulatory-like domain-containing protein [Pyrinomonadaceae bacterium]